MLKTATAAILSLVCIAAPAADARTPTRCPVQWKLVGSDTFRLHDTLMRSQGVTTDGSSWFFSWQGGLSRTLDNFTPIAAATLPPDLAAAGGDHIGDIDYYNGLIYAPVEDGEQDLGVTKLNDPEYQKPRVALYDASTLLYTGVSYPLDLGIQQAGVPWVAVDARRREVYTAEWEMPHNRLNVFDTQMHFKRFLELHYPAELGADFRLSRIQGAKVYGHTMYASRDDTDKTVFSIDLRSGEVTKLFSMKPVGHDELEGIAVRRTPDGALLHVLLVMNNDLPDQAAEIYVAFNHYAPTRACS